MGTRTVRTDGGGRSSGFTLIELLLVLVILTILAAVVIPRFTRRSEDARITAAKADIANLGTGLDAFEIDNGRYPSTEEGLAALDKAPGDLTKWHGPYIKQGVPNDPWGTPYHYESPGRHNTDDYDLWSYGPNKQDGGDDDIDNWTRQ